MSYLNSIFLYRFPENTSFHVYCVISSSNLERIKKTDPRLINYPYALPSAVPNPALTSPRELKKTFLLFLLSNCIHGIYHNCAQKRYRTAHLRCVTAHDSDHVRYLIHQQ